MRVWLVETLLEAGVLARKHPIEHWLDGLMQTPEFSLAELAESNPNYRLAVIHTGTSTAYAGWNGDPMDLKYSVVKMEER
jgi:hypothetical protein